MFSGLLFPFCFQNVILNSHLSMFHELLIMVKRVLKNVFFHIMEKILTAMCGIEDYKTRLKK